MVQVDLERWGPFVSDVSTRCRSERYDLLSSFPTTKDSSYSYLPEQIITCPCCSRHWRPFRNANDPGIPVPELPIIIIIMVVLPNRGRVVCHTHPTR
jgi:hypothetical protein